MTTAIYWFRYDLRLQDNSGWNQLANSHDSLVGVFVLPQRWLDSGDYGTKGLGAFRLKFLLESLQDLRMQLRELGSDLVMLVGDPATEVAAYAQSIQAAAVAVGEHPGSDEQDDVAKARRLVNIPITQSENFTLFNRAELPFELNELPDIFSQFRKRVERQAIQPLAAPPAQPRAAFENSHTLCQLDSWIASIQPVNAHENAMQFVGGTRAAQRQLDYFLLGSHKIATYKETRNQLDGWEFSSKLSPWLALGCISAREVAHAITAYERDVAANESTYWLYFELLWREYFQWLAYRYGKRMFALRGIQNKNPQLGFSPEKWAAWRQGTTGCTFVDAFMRQLLHTGWMSNRGRQIVASYLINELGVDWRYGAAWFEQQLIDYDVAANWGNWQYLAGVGTDPRGRRHFNIEKQRDTYDPDFHFTHTWTK